MILKNLLLTTHVAEMWASDDIVSISWLGDDRKSRIPNQERKAVLLAPDSHEKNFFHFGSGKRSVRCTAPV